MRSISFAKHLLEILLNVLGSQPCNFFLKFTISIPDLFPDQLMLIMLLCKKRSPESILASFVTRKFQNSLKLDPSESVLDPWRAIKRNEILSIYCVKDFWGFSGFVLRLRSIINVIPSVLCQRLWDKFYQDLCHF